MTDHAAQKPTLKGSAVGDCKSAIAVRNNQHKHGNKRTLKESKWLHLNGTRTKILGTQKSTT